MGLHVFFGCYFNLFRLMAKCGVLENLLLKVRVCVGGGDASAPGFSSSGGRAGAPSAGSGPAHLSGPARASRLVHAAPRPATPLPQEHTHTFCNLDGDVRELDFRFFVNGTKIGAPFHGGPGLGLGFGWVAV
jgi:uncharacterized protein with NAD-binding domain and iron-sulfur cluster